jgi:glycerol-3-phosphate O-acyltransferase
MRNVALTYAVGEWALVWPLDRLFKAFGSYFVRRGEKDPLYHTVLERFVQRLVGHGGVTGFFLEGRLSRDGRIGKAKGGLFDYIIGIRREQPDFDLWFVPVGLNYDRIIEDRHMVAEHEGRRKPDLLERVQTIIRILLRLPILVVDNVLKIATGSHRKFGYAAVVVGDPIRFADIEGASELPNLPREERRERVAELAQQILRHSESLIPVTPVPLFCNALLGGENLRLTEVTRRVHSRVQLLQERGVSLALGHAFEGPQTRELDASGIPGLDEALISLADAEMVTTLAGHSLARRRLIRLVDGVFQIRENSEPLLRFYANSIEHHLEKEGDA